MSSRKDKVSRFIDDIWQYFSDFYIFGNYLNCKQFREEKLEDSKSDILESIKELNFIINPALNFNDKILNFYQFTTFFKNLEWNKNPIIHKNSALYITGVYKELELNINVILPISQEISFESSINNFGYNKKYGLINFNKNYTFPDFFNSISKKKTILDKYFTFDNFINLLHNNWIVSYFFNKQVYYDFSLSNSEEICQYCGNNKIINCSGQDKEFTLCQTYNCLKYQLNKEYISLNTNLEGETYLLLIPKVITKEIDFKNHPIM